MAATAIKTMVMMMMVIMGKAESNPTPTPMDHAFPNARTITTHARHGHLLHGMLGGLESYVFDDVVEFLFQQLGEELPYARSRYNNLYHYESEDYYSLPSEYINRKDSGQSCIGMAGNTGSSTICLNVFSALCVAGLALLMQFLFFACVSNLCPGIMNSSSGSGGGGSNITNIITIDTSNDVSVEQNDDIDIINRPNFEDDRLRSDIQRSDLDEDVNLDEHGDSNDRDNIKDNTRERKKNARFRVTINGVDREDVDGDGIYYGRELQKKQTQILNMEKKEKLIKDDEQRTESSQKEKWFSMKFLQDNLIGDFFSWDRWELALPSLGNNTSICPILSRYIHR
ncbi:uncharacterized protein LOC123507142 [Portunus trituberculatus]|uniref:uncharacterized protein LOC123507142 n=1 Tax=Portunus trituberculatus TaxID=210409 RepID=UPI001E1CC4EA|nr:uncharacterized protein LOC123507142 [Portunus trituberculatus]